jgi:hypothetical protein
LGSTSSIAADSSIAPNEGLNPIARTGDAKSLPAQGLRLLEHGTRAFRVIDGNHDLRGAERGAGKIDIHVCAGELPGQLPERHGPVPDRDHQDLTLVSDSDSGMLTGRSAAGQGVVVQEHGDDPPACTREGRKGHGY